MMIKKVLITGGAGFIGSHSAELLLQKGCHVIIYDNLSSGKITHLNLEHPHLEFVEGDILDFDLLKSSIARCDTVLHLAAIASVPESIKNPIRSLKINSLGFLNILEAIRELQKKIRVVFASSAAVYGAAEVLPCDDAPPLADLALSPYALDKANNERYAKLYRTLFGIQSLGLRYFNVYGERQNPSSMYSGVISKFLENYRLDRPLTIYGNGEQTRDFIYVIDVARANYLSLMNSYEGVLNIATGQPQSLLSLICCIEKAGKRSSFIEHEAARQGDIQRSYAATNKAERAIDFSYTTPLEEGIQLLWQCLAT
jgi:UDP-glucose 4-epimerase